MFKTIRFLLRLGPTRALLVVVEDLLTFLADGPSVTLTARVNGSAGKAKLARARILALPGARNAIESIAKLASSIAERPNG
jgi:hypothetical protein